MPDQPDCFVCKSPFDQHGWRSIMLGLCPGMIWNIRGVYAGTYWPQSPDGERADSWEPHPVLSPLEQVLVNNIETIREVIDNWFLWDADPDANPTQLSWHDPDLLERAHILRREIAELSGELE